MESRCKLRIARMFRSSFWLCRSRNLSDVIERPVFIPQNRQNFQLIEACSPRPRPFPSICRPKCSETESCLVTKELYPRSKISDRNSLLLSDEWDGRKCPPASPISPLKDKFQECQSKSKEKKMRKIAKKKIRLKIKKCEKDQFGSFVVNNRDGWFSSDDDEETTLFSSKSLSSDSSDSFRRNKGRYRHKTATIQRRRATRNECETGVGPILQGKVKDSLAVVKRSSDPYNDFRDSMVEMIVEKEIFSGKELENMLECFLSLNSYHHHRVIIQVFTEILEALARAIL